MLTHIKKYTYIHTNFLFKFSIQLISGNLLWYPYTASTLFWIAVDYTRKCQSPKQYKCRAAWDGKALWSGCDAVVSEDEQRWNEDWRELEKALTLVNPE